MKGQTEGGRRDGRGLPAPSIHSLAACRIASAPRAFCCSSTRLSSWPTSVVNSEPWALTARVVVWAASFMPWVKLSAVWRALVPTVANLAIIALHGKPVAIQPMAGLFQTATARVCGGKDRACSIPSLHAMLSRPMRRESDTYPCLPRDGKPSRDNSPGTTQFRASGLAADGKGPVTASLRIGPRPALRLGPRACAWSLRGRPAGRCRNGLE